MNKIDKFIEACQHPIHLKEYKRPKEIEDIIDDLADFDSYSFYQDNLGKLIDYIEELETAIKNIAYVVAK